MGFGLCCEGSRGLACSEGEAGVCHFDKTRVKG